MSQQKFASILLCKVRVDEPLPSDIYVKISEKYIKYKSKGDSLSGEKYNLFVAKNVKNIFVIEYEHKQFESWLEVTKQRDIEQTVKDVGEENREFVIHNEKVKELVYNTFSDEKLSSETVDILQKNAKELAEKVSKKPVPVLALAKMMKHSQSIADHVTNVANLAVFIAMASGHGHEYVLEKVYLGGILHDLGKVKVDPKILENPGNSLYSHSINQHPVTALKMIEKMKGISDEVKTIVAEHHEHFNGGGYPKGLKGESISELTRIVSIANVFDNVCTENKARGKEEMYSRAIKYLEVDRGKQFDPALIKRTIEALKLAFGGYYREREVDES